MREIDPTEEKNLAREQKKAKFQASVQEILRRLASASPTDKQRLLARLKNLLESAVSAGFSVSEITDQNVESIINALPQETRADVQQCIDDTSRQEFEFELEQKEGAELRANVGRLIQENRQCLDDLKSTVEEAQKTNPPRTEQIDAVCNIIETLAAKRRETREIEEKLETLVSKQDQRAKEYAARRRQLVAERAVVQHRVGQTETITQDSAKSFVVPQHKQHAPTAPVELRHIDQQIAAVDQAAAKNDEEMRRNAAALKTSRDMYQATRQEIAKFIQKTNDVLGRGTAHHPDRKDKIKDALESLDDVTSTLDGQSKDTAKSVTKPDTKPVRETGTTTDTKVAEYNEAPNKSEKEHATPIVKVEAAKQVEHVNHTISDSRSRDATRAARFRSPALGSLIPGTQSPPHTPPISKSTERGQGTDGLSK